MYIHIHMYSVHIIYVYIPIYGIVWLRAPNESRPFHSSWTRTLLGVRVKRAQLLWNVHNFLQTRTTSMNSMTSSQTLQRALNQTIPIDIYIYRDMTVYVYIPQVRGWHLRFHPDAFRGAPIRRAAPGSIPRRHRGASTAAWRLQG